MERQRAREILELAEAADGEPERLTHVADEVASALRFLIDDDRAAALRLAGLLTSFWEDTGRVDEGRRLTDDALEGQHRAATLDRDVAAAIPRALLAASDLAFRQGDQDEARRQARAAIRAAVLIEDHRAAGQAELSLSRVAFRDRDGEAIDKHARKALEYGRGDGKVKRGALHMLAWAAYTKGDLDEAERRFEESLAFRRDAESGPVSIASELSNLGDIAVERGDLRRGSRYLAEALQLASQARSQYMIVNLLPSFAALAVRAQRHEDAARLFGVADGVAAAAGLIPDPGGEHAESRDEARKQLGEAAFATLLAEGARASTDDAVQLAQNLADQID